MMKRTRSSILLIIIMTFILQSCFKEDEKGPPYIPGSLQADTMNVGINYETQSYFDLYTMQEVSSNSIYDWSLAFVTGESNWHVLLNSALMMRVGNTFSTDFLQVSSSDGLEMRFDVSSGNLDSTAIGDWHYSENGLNLSYGYVYVIDIGSDADGIPLGFRKMILGVDGEKYTIRHANLDGSDEKNVIIEKEEFYNYMHLSFEDGLVSIEPRKDQWSLKFSRYSTILFTDEGDAYPYNLIGVLLNPHLVEANLNLDDFFQITSENINDYEYRSKADIIGYSWKEYDFDSGVYSVLNEKTYMIKNNDDFYYRLRFISFYDAQGNKGNVGFQFSRL